MHGLAVHEWLVRLAGPALDHARVERRHVAALTAVQVLDVAAAAQRLDVLVDQVGARGGRAPREVDPAAEQDGEREPRKRRAARLVPAAVQVELHEDARVVVPYLRPRHEERLAGRGALRTDEQGIRHGQPGRGRVVTCRRLPAPGVDDEIARLAGRPASVGEPARDRDARLRVVALAQVLPHLAPAVRPELLLQLCEELRAPYLVTSTGAEHRTHQPRNRDDVVPRPFRQRQPRLCVLRVDAGDEGVDDLQRLPPLRPLRGEQRILAGEERLGLCTRDERPPGERKGEGVDPGCVERGDPAGTAE